MTEAEWLACIIPERLLRRIRNVGQAGAYPVTDRKFRLYAVAACREVWRLLTPTEREAVAFAEEHAEGHPDNQERERLRSAVGDAATRGGYSPSGAVYWLLSHSTSPYRTDSLTPPLIAIAVALNLYGRDDADPIFLSALVHEIFRNPFRPVAFSPEWRTDTAVSLARTMYESREFGAMPILADALQDAGCDNDDILSHCRGAGPHVRGCWVIDLVLGKQ